MYTTRDSPLLNLSTPTSKWTANRCQIVKDKYFVKKFEIPVIDPQIKILQAVSFYIIKDNLKGEQCLTTFQGNRYVIFDTKFNCTRDFLWEPTKEADIVLVNKEHHKCIEHGNRTSHWKEVLCSRKVFKREYVQINKRY